MRKASLLLSTLALAALVIAPAATFARSNASAHLHISNRDEVHAQAVKVKSDANIKVKADENENNNADIDMGFMKGCALPPGHLIAPGWLRKHANLVSSLFSTSSPCRVQMVPLALANIHLAPTTGSVTVSWKTNKPATSELLYGTTTAYGQSTMKDSNLTTMHSQTITGLTANTIYHVRIQSVDAKGNVVASDDQALTTAALPVISVISANPTSTDNTVIRWTTNVAATSKVYYAAGATVDITSPSTLIKTDNSLVTSHAVALTGLAPDTTYSFVVSSQDAFSNSVTSGQQSLLTL